MSALTVSGEVQAVYIWILGGTLSFLVMIGTVIISAYFSSLGKKIEELTKSINGLSENNIQQAGQIATLFSDKAAMTDRINDHAKRIRAIEITCSKHGNKIEVV